MHLQTFKAPTMAEALAQVKREMGHTAVILHTRTYQHRYWMGLRRREIVEITAGKGLNVDRRRAAGHGQPVQKKMAPKAQIQAYAPTTMAFPGKALLDTPAGNGAAMLGLTQEMTSLKTIVKDLVDQVRHQQAPLVPEELFA